MAQQTTTSPKPRASQGPLPSPKRSRGRQEKPTIEQPPPRTAGGRQELASPADAAVTGDNQGGGQNDELPPKSDAELDSGVAKLEPRVEQRPLGPREPPPPATGGRRLELDVGHKEEIPSECAEEQTEGASKAPVPGDFIRRYLSPKGKPGSPSCSRASKTDTPRSGESGDTLVAD